MTDVRVLKLTVAGALASLLSACGHLPASDAAFSEMTAARTGLPQDWTLAPMSGTGAEIVSDYSVFGDAQLTAFVKEALDNNRSLKASMETVTRSQALLKQTRSGLFPSIRAAVGASSTSPAEDLSFDEERYSFSVTGGYSADIMGDLSSSIQASLAGLRSTEASYELARRQLAAQVARAYFTVLEQQLQLDLSRRTIQRARDTYRITQTRFEAGAVARDELVLGESSLAASEDAVIAAESSVRSAVRALEVLIGRFPQNGVTLQGALPDTPRAPALGLPELTVRARPDVVAAEYGLIQTFASNQIARLAPWPQLDASLSLQLNNATLNTTNALFDLDAMALSIGASVAQSIFDGGAIRGRIEASDADKRAALYRYGQTIISAYSDVVSAIDQFNTLESRSRSLQAASDAARETLRLSELRYNEGSQSLLDLISVRDRADSAESRLIANKRLRLEQWIALHQALGGDPVAASPLPQASDTAQGL
jgi:NodT family efflux transporter outer membrane factor (OMF) lipoprotein